MNIFDLFRTKKAEPAQEYDEPLKVLELFGGIGAFTLAMRRVGIPFEVVDYVEIDKFACKSYNASTAQILSRRTYAIGIRISKLTSLCMDLRVRTSP